MVFKTNFMKHQCIYRLVLLMTICVINSAFSQNSAINNGAQVVTVQPKIMVIPHTNEGEDLRTVLENDIIKIGAITKIKEGFSNKGFTTIDFNEKLKEAIKNNVFTYDNQTDIKSKIIQMSSADIYVEVEVIIEKSSAGNSVKLILTGYEASKGNLLSSIICESGKFYTDEFNKLASKAVERCNDDFLNITRRNIKLGIYQSIPCIYDKVYEFEEGLASVKLNGTWSFIDKTGKEIFKYQQDDYHKEYPYSNFHEGLSIATFGDYNNESSYFINKHGDKVSPVYHYASAYINGLACVEFKREIVKYGDSLQYEKENFKWRGLINKNGDKILTCNCSDAVFQNGLLIVDF